MTFIEYFFSIGVYFLFNQKNWSSGPGQRVMALPEESLEEFEVN